MEDAKSQIHRCPFNLGCCFRAYLLPTKPASVLAGLLDATLTRHCLAIPTTPRRSLAQLPSPTFPVLGRSVSPQACSFLRPQDETQFLDDKTVGEVNIGLFG
jgi:hypothetical protein